MDACTRFDTQRVGALPVISSFCDLLQLGETVDRVVPWEGEVPLGDLVEVLVINRLLQPKAMFRIGEWAQTAGVTDYFKLTAEQLNDDRLGRALERIADHREAIQAPLVLGIIHRFKLDVSQVHYDISDVELYGAYELDIPEGQPAPTPMPAYGRTKSGRKNVKQIQFGLNVARDGAVPVAHLPLDGNAAESPSHLANLKQLARILPKQELLYIADSKLDTPENLRTVVAANGQFLCAGAFSPTLQQQFLTNRKKLRRVDYFPKSQATKPAEERDRYEAFEVTERLEGMVDGRTIRCTYRQIFVWSQARARDQATTRERHVAKIREAFEAVEKNLGRYSLKTREAIVRRLEAARAKYSEGTLFAYELTERRGKFTLSWKIDPKLLAEWKHLEGVYVLKTNLSKRTYPIAKLLETYRDQKHVERRIHHLKGPLAIAPMFLENPKRIAGLLCILVLALMVLALMERQVRRRLRGKPMYGLYPENRPSPAPTGPALLDCFSTLCIVIIKHHGDVTRRLADPTATQREILKLLDIDSARLQTFKRRCGM
jgi:transposase